MQKNNLLIGNGVNLCGATSDFSSRNIASRFGEMIRKRMLNNDDKNIKYFDGIDRELKFEGYEQNIEALASVVYKYICKKYMDDEQKDLSLNIEMKFISLIKNMAINALFLKDSNFIEIEIPRELVSKIESYGNILTLNYFEYWDKNNTCTYLHGNFGEPFNTKLTKSKTDEMIFSPAFNNRTKSDVVNMGCYPSDRLYPAPDLYPKKPVMLYENLDNIQRIEVFGVSPYGDDELIDKLNTISEVKIFVHQMNQNEETTEWKNKVSFAEIVDVSDFYS